MLEIRVIALVIVLLAQGIVAQQVPTDATTPLHQLQPNYPVPYGIPKAEDVKSVLTRVYRYLDSVTPTGFVNEKTGEDIVDLSKIDENTILKRGDFRIVSYEWGVTYAGMLFGKRGYRRSAFS